MTEHAPIPYHIAKPAWMEFSGTTARILVLNASEEDAADMLYRRETGRVGQLVWLPPTWIVLDVDKLRGAGRLLLGFGPVPDLGTTTSRKVRLSGPKLHIRSPRRFLELMDIHQKQQIKPPS